jgi:hypothetical protein
MKTLLITTISNKVGLVSFTPKKHYITPVTILHGGLFIPPGYNIICNNSCNFACVREVNKRGLVRNEKIYEVDLGFASIEVVLIPDCINIFIFEVEVWKNNHNWCLDIIERHESKPFMPPTKGYLEIMQTINKEVREYLLGN